MKPVVIDFTKKLWGDLFVTPSTGSHFLTGTSTATYFFPLRSSKSIMHDWWTTLPSMMAVFPEDIIQSLTRFLHRGHSLGSMIAPCCFLGLIETVAVSRDVCLWNVDALGILRCNDHVAERTETFSHFCFPLLKPT